MVVDAVRLMDDHGAKLLPQLVSLLRITAWLLEPHQWYSKYGNVAAKPFDLQSWRNVSIDCDGFALSTISIFPIRRLMSTGLNLRHGLLGLPPITHNLSFRFSGIAMITTARNRFFRRNRSSSLLAFLTASFAGPVALLSLGTFL